MGGDDRWKRKKVEGRSGEAAGCVELRSRRAGPAREATDRHAPASPPHLVLNRRHPRRLAHGAPRVNVALLGLGWARRVPSAGLGWAGSEGVGRPDEDGAAVVSGGGEVIAAQAVDVTAKAQGLAKRREA